MMAAATPSADLSALSTLLAASLAPLESHRREAESRLAEVSDQC